MRLTTILRVALLCVVIAVTPAFFYPTSRAESVATSSTMECGHYMCGPTPTITSGFGTSPSIVGNPHSFIITIGSGGAVTGVVTFVDTGWPGPPVCNATSSTINAVGGDTSTRTWTLNSGATLSAGSKLHVQCSVYQ